MKPYITFSLIRIFIFFLIASVSCKKSDSLENGSASGGNQTISYTFTNPINIKVTNPLSSTIFFAQEIITNNYIYTALGYPGVGNPTNLRVTRIPIGSSSSQSINSLTTAYQFNPSNFLIKLGTTTRNLFTVDESDQNLFILSKGDPALIGGGCCGTSVGYQIFKWDLSSLILSRVTAGNQLDILEGMDLKCFRIGPDASFYISSTAYNGSIIKISATGSITTIATNLINPGYFAITENSLFVPINSISGKIIKIDQNNNIQTIIQNLTGPTNVDVDNYGSLVVRSQTTIDGGNYHRYDIYKQNGSFIANVKDESGNSILSNTYENMPMIFDSFNNLYLYHADGVVNGGFTYNNPIGQKGLFKIGIIRK